MEIYAQGLLSQLTETRRAVGFERLRGYRQPEGQRPFELPYSAE